MMTIERQAPKGGGIPPTGSEQMQRTRNFLQETVTELKKTKWPTKAEAWRLTYVVIAVIVALSIYMGLLDVILTALTTRLLK